MKPMKLRLIWEDNHLKEYDMRVGHIHDLSALTIGNSVTSVTYCKSRNVVSGLASTVIRRFLCLICLFVSFTPWKIDNRYSVQLLVFFPSKGIQGELFREINLTLSYVVSEL